ncbi:MAG: hypothetical protein JNM66_07440 [Bryobacterales bacterium]|nr:hypothetical protein [Bryobacterales bacterium]
MHSDYAWPSVYFAYLFFAILFALAGYFFVKTRRDGYWGDHSEDVKFQMLKED